MNYIVYIHGKEEMIKQNIENTLIISNQMDSYQRIQNQNDVQYQHLDERNSLSSTILYHGYESSQQCN